ncbi:hypothetical protein D3C76_703200 [compost metagenome]|nr:hypothetical protein BSF44_22890 [Pseudomonas sp. ACN8]
MQWNRFVERTLWALWLLVFGGAGLWVVVGSIGYFNKTGWLPNEASAWVQAIGSILAILVAALIASGDRRFTKNNIRAREKVVIRAVEERCLNAFDAIGALNYRLRNHYRPITPDSPADVRRSLERVDEILRDLNAIDLMSMPTTEVVECVLNARAIVQMCQRIALEGWDPRPAVQAREYSPLKVMLEQMQAQMTNLERCATSV